MNQDLISRQAILKHIEKKRQDALMIDDLRESNIIMMGMKLLDEAVWNQPSAQPEKMQLSKEDATKGTTFDCISRKDAIDVLHGYFDGMLETDTVCPADIYGLFECIPSAQPEQSSEIQNILEYLDTVLHPIVSPDHWNVYSELHDMISMLASAQPEIIRCNDCKWCEDADGLMCKNPASWVVATDYDFGCVCAERRQDG